MGKPVALSEGNPTRVIPPQDANEQHIMTVTGTNAVRVGHTRYEAQNGVQLTAGQRHRVSNLQGEELYAVSIGGDSEVRISKAAADVEPLAERDVAVVEGDITDDVSGSIDVSDRQGREAGKVRVMNSGGVLVDPATDSTLSSTLEREVATWTAGVLDVAIDNEPVAVSESGAELTTVATGRVTVTAAGTAEQLPTVTVDGELTITALSGNAGTVYVGDSTVDATSGDPLQPGQSITVSINNADGLYVDADNGGDTISYLAEQA